MRMLRSSYNWTTQSPLPTCPYHVAPYPQRASFQRQITNCYRSPLELLAPCIKPSCDDGPPSASVHHWLQKGLSYLLSLSLLLHPTAAIAEEMSIAFPASTDPDIRRAQQTMVESWAYVQALYLDPSFSHQDWSKALQDSLAASFKAKNAADVAELTQQLLAQLGDPYTRLLQGDDAAALAAEEQGKIIATGLGLQQVPYPEPYPAAAAPISPSAPAGGEAAVPMDVSTADAANSSITAGPEQHQQQQSPDGALLVAFVVDGSPAAAAGVQEGDVVLAVGDQAVAGQRLRDVYKLLSKEADVTLARQQLSAVADGSGISGLPLQQLAPATAAGSTGFDKSYFSSSSSSKRSPSSGLADVQGDINITAASASTSASPAAATWAGIYTVHLKPEPLEFTPVQYGIIHTNNQLKSLASSSVQATEASAQQSLQLQQQPTAAAPAPAGDGTDSSTTSSTRGSATGMPAVAYLKLLSFSATAPQQVAEALIDMQQLKSQQQLQLQRQQQENVEVEETGQQQPLLIGLILDLRDNVGGIVEAGVDIAQDFLRADQVLCIAVDRSGQEEQVVLPSAHTLTNLPLVVLVNRNTASTAELVAGALHDDLAAPLVGTTTYGKGRSQRVVQLADGKSTLLVSTIKYFTPQGTVIDQVGLQPDVVCDPEEVGGQRWQGGRLRADAGSNDTVSLLDDPCIRVATDKLTALASMSQVTSS